VGKIACRSRGIFAYKGRDFAHAVDAGSDRVGNGEEVTGAIANIVDIVTADEEEPPPVR